jgi:hypothetical protein
VQRCLKAAWLEHDQPSIRSAGVGRQPAQRRLVTQRQSFRQVDQQQVHGPSGKQGCRDGQPFLRLFRADDQQPAQVNAAAGRLERIEDASNVDDGGDGALRLGLRDAVQGERGLATRARPAQRSADRPRQATSAKQRVEAGKAGRHAAGRRYGGQ